MWGRSSPLQPLSLWRLNPTELAHLMSNGWLTQPTAINQLGRYANRAYCYRHHHPQQHHQYSYSPTHWETAKLSWPRWLIYYHHGAHLYDKKVEIYKELTWANAISTAPPPGTSLASTITLRATFIASCRLRSTSLRMSLLAPRSMMVHAFGFLHSTRNVKYLHVHKVNTLHKARKKSAISHVTWAEQMGSCTGPTDSPSDGLQRYTGRPDGCQISLCSTEMYLTGHRVGPTRWVSSCSTD